MVFQRNPHPKNDEWLAEKPCFGLSRNDAYLLMLVGVLVGILMSMDWDRICGLR